MKGICFFITSTFGNGTHPTSAKSLAEWLDAKLNDSEDDVYERLNTMIQTQLSTEEFQSSRISEIIREDANISERMPIKDGQVPPMVSRKSQMKLGKLPSRKTSIEQGKRKASKTLSRRISMATFTPINSEFSDLR